MNFVKTKNYSNLMIELGLRLRLTTANHQKSKHKYYGQIKKIQESEQT